MLILHKKHLLLVLALLLPVTSTNALPDLPDWLTKTKAGLAIGAVVIVGALVIGGGKQKNNNTTQELLKKAQDLRRIIETRYTPELTHLKQLQEKSFGAPGYEDALTRLHAHLLGRYTIENNKVQSPIIYEITILNRDVLGKLSMVIQELDSCITNCITDHMHNEKITAALKAELLACRALKQSIEYMVGFTMLSNSYKNELREAHKLESKNIKPTLSEFDQRSSSAHTDSTVQQSSSLPVHQQGLARPA